jgi:hypothetical protein
MLSKTSHRSEWLSIVVCEHDKATMESLCDHLTADRHEVLPAPTASDALRLRRYNEPERRYPDLGSVRQEQKRGTHRHAAISRLGAFGLDCRRLP